MTPIPAGVGLSIKAARTVRHAQQGQKAIVIGENMDRVKRAAKDLQAASIDAKWYQSWGRTGKISILNEI